MRLGLMPFTIKPELFTESNMGASGIIGHWPLGGSHVVGTVARDISRNKNNGVITVGGGGLTTGIHEESNGAYYFGGNSKIAIPTFNLSSISFTVAFWLKSSYTDADASDRLFSMTLGVLGANAFIYNGVGENNGAFFFRESDGTIHTGGNIKTFDNIWHHVVALNDGSASGAKLYLDGVWQNSTTQNDSFVLDEYMIGARTNDLNNFDGSLYDVIILTYPMSAGQVADLYQSYAKPYGG